MRRALSLVVLLALGAGCSHISGTRTAQGDLTIDSSRFLWSSEGIVFSLTDTNGFTTALSVTKSSSHAEAIAAAFTGAKELATTMAAAKP